MFSLKNGKAVNK